MPHRVWHVGIPYALCSVLMGLGIRPQPAVAQSLIVPDSTLGAERSQVIENVDGTSNDLIVGGARRAQNLFHSFEAFSVGEGRGAFFDSPGGLENIFSRVTGSSPSEIFGTLGVDGSANLFFLNPNGIVFGENSSLAVEGSFVGSTASEIAFADGSVFSAVAPADSLLTVSVPLGLQYGPPPPGSTLTNRGAIAAGQDLTLAADVLDLRGELGAGRDLTLRADALQIRDAVDAPFVAASGGAMVLQGDSAVDIFALNHPESGFFAGGDLTLRSAAPVVGDARYWSGGNLSIETLLGDPGALTSPNDPVLRAAGDVTFDSYTGASLHIIAGGSVAIPGAIAITGADPANGLAETVTLSDGSTVAVNGQVQPTLDIRAGTLAVGTAGLTGDGSGFAPGVPAGGGAATSADITLGDVTVPTDGLVLVTNQFMPNTALPGGAIALGEVTAPSSVAGDAVVIDGRTSLDVLGDIETSPVNSAISASGGDIFIAAAESVSLNNSDIASRLDANNTVDNGGDIDVITGTLSLLNSSDIANGTNGIDDGGSVTIIATESVTLADSSNLFSVAGVITVVTPALSLLGNSGILTTTNGNGDAGSISLSGTRNAGIVSIDTRTLALDDSIIVAVSGGTGNAGSVTLSVCESVTLSNGSDVRVRLDAGGVGNAGNIDIETGDLSVLGGSDINARTNSAGNGGNINITASGLVTVDGAGSNVVSRVTENGVGSGGDITINAGTLQVLNSATLLAGTSGVGAAGNITIDANAVTFDSNGAAFTDVEGGTGNGGDIRITTGTLDVLDGGSLQSDNGRLSLSPEEQGVGNAGNITITARDRVTFSGSGETEASISRISSGVTAGAVGDAGNIRLTLQFWS